MNRKDNKYLRSYTSTQGRLMAGARALWRANGMKDEQMGKPIIAVVNSFTQFVPGHAHLHDIGQMVKAEIEKLGCFAAEFNTIAVDDGIAMGHDGMLYSLPSRDLIADSIEYMINAHKVDAMVCISNCDKITPGMLMAAMRLNIPAIFVSGGPMEAGKIGDESIDLIDAMIESADDAVSDDRISQLEKLACTARQRNDRGHTRQPVRTLPQSSGTDRGERLPLLFRRRRKRAAEKHRHTRGVPQRHVARHCHGRLHQHHPSPAGHCP